MEHKLDDFLRKRLETIETKLPENTGFDEDLLWVELQKNLHRAPRRHGRKWLIAAACLIGLAISIFALLKIGEPTKQPVAIAPPHPATKVIPPVVINHNPTRPTIVKKQKPVKKEIVESKHEVLPEIKELAIRAPQPEILISPVIKDSIAIKPPVVAATKPRFKVIHVNEITDPEKESVPQPRFKIRFAARNPH